VTQNLLYDQQGSIVTLTLNDPELRNAISGMEVIDALVAALDRINKDYEVRCVILTGAGSAFSSGGNVKDMKDRGGMFGGDVYGVRTELSTLLDMSASMQAIAHQSEDHMEAVNAFLEKRKPVFKGR